MPASLGSAPSRSPASVGGNHQAVISYLGSCMNELGRRYKSTNGEIAEKTNMDTNNFQSILDNFDPMKYTSEGIGSDHALLTSLQGFASFIGEHYVLDAAVQQGSSRPEVQQYQQVCRSIAALANRELALVNQAPSLERNGNENTALCEGSGHRCPTAKSCAVGCFEMGGGDSHPACGFFDSNELFASLREEANQCIEDLQAGQENPPSCNTPEMEAPNCSERARELADGDDATTGPNAGDGDDTDTGPEGDFTTASVDPTGAGPTNNGPTGGDTPPSQETPPSDDSPTNDVTDNDAEELEETADRLARQMFGAGQNMNFQRGNPSGSLEAPDISMDGQAVSSASFDTVQDGRGVSAPQLNPNQPLAAMPLGSAQGRPGGKPKQGGSAAGGPGGRSAGGGGGGVGSGGASAGGAPAKGGNRGGVRVNQRLKAIADGLGTNRFLSADGAKGGANAAPQAIERRISPQLKKQIAKNRETANKDALNAALQRNLNSPEKRKALFLKASYFPDNSNIYYELRESGDLLNESGL